MSWTEKIAEFSQTVQNITNWINPLPNIDVIEVGEHVYDISKDVIVEGKTIPQAIGGEAVETIGEGAHGLSVTLFGEKTTATIEQIVDNLGEALPEFLKLIEPFAQGIKVLSRLIEPVMRYVNEVVDQLDSQTAAMFGMDVEEYRAYGDYLDIKQSGEFTGTFEEYKAEKGITTENAPEAASKAKPASTPDAAEKQAGDAAKKDTPRIEKNSEEIIGDVKPPTPEEISQWQAPVPEEDFWNIEELKSEWKGFQKNLLEFLGEASPVKLDKTTATGLKSVMAPEVQNAKATIEKMTAMQKQPMTVSLAKQTLQMSQSAIHSYSNAIAKGRDMLKTITPARYASVDQALSIAKNMLPAAAAGPVSPAVTKAVSILGGGKGDSLSQAMAQEKGQVQENLPTLSFDM